MRLFFCEAYQQNRKKDFMINFLNGLLRRGWRTHWNIWLNAIILLVFLVGCVNEADVVLPTRIILPTATQTLTPVLTTTALAPTPAPLLTQQSTSTSTPVLTEVGRFFSGDIHNHTWLTDGYHSEAEILRNAFEAFHLDYLANSEHGGAFSKNPDGKYWTDPSLSPITLLGDPFAIKIKNPNGQVMLQPVMWRWQSLLDFSWPLLFGGKDGYGAIQSGLQALYPTHLLIQGVEWNVPTHEHASVGIINQPDGTAISQFEYQYDENDHDTSLTNLKKYNLTHADALTAVKSLADRYGQNVYVVINHPSRQLLYSASDLRELNDAAPSTVIGLEGFPGHQKAAERGEYGLNFPDRDQTARARTYGGADYMLAKLGGLMDSLWGEGRHFWVFDNSDFHNDTDDADFWPGEYAKTYIFAKDLSAANIVEGMRSGQVFIVSGDLINGLDFHFESGGSQAVMGSELKTAPGNPITVIIRFQSPQKNTHGDPVIVDHIDLIAGDVGPSAEPGSEAYKNDNNPSTQVVKTFTAVDWKDENGWKTITYKYQVVKNQYFRLRGTNLDLNVPRQTQNGNPLIDDLVGKNDSTQAWADLWFYSNPIFVKINP
jgi:hypothetical protein